MMKPACPRTAASTRVMRGRRPAASMMAVSETPRSKSMNGSCASSTNFTSLRFHNACPVGRSASNRSLQTGCHSQSLRTGNSKTPGSISPPKPLVSPVSRRSTYRYLMVIHAKPARQNGCPYCITFAGLASLVLPFLLGVIQFPIIESVSVALFLILP